ncbi:AI-2E family transporter [Halopseudomonas nanhaiensis]|uniref:AI-2E family transporter n=1 Tax=Halopseudomonas nanhaiensis TaxID=2830842 RepID=UPI001CBD380E|nr:AI-2E family transporter [Halopseudomonas nanhaiensis]UAW98893.1 AI-2E family transporter [Halopseudomonas nanhaiensis]
MTDRSGTEPFGQPSEPPSSSSDDELPQPRPSRLLVWLLGLALLYTLYFAKSLIMPLVVALLFALLLSPVVSGLKRLHVPRTLSAVVLLGLLLGPFTVLAVQLSEPVQKWAKRMPELSATLAEQVDSLTDAFDLSEPTIPEPPPRAEPEEGGFRLFGFLRRDEPPAPEPAPQQRQEDQEGGEVTARIKQGGIEVLVSVLSATPMVIAQFLTAIILILFLLIFGPSLFANFIQICPEVKNKRISVILVRTIQKELSRYIVTVTVINACLGMVTGGALWLMGVEDALLWGVLVALVNYAPYVGPLIGILILGLAGLAQYGLEWAALIPALVYFSINLLEAQFVTPTVLGMHMRLNPLVIMVWLIIWGWLWGAVGVLLAVPLLVCVKLIAGQLNVFPTWVRLIETQPSFKPDQADA